MPEPIPFLDLDALHRPIRDELEATFSRVLQSSQLILGEELAAFEAEFATYCGTRYCIGTGNGLDALTLTLIAAGVGAGDEVIVPGQTFVATWMAVSHAGATPVPADIDPETRNISIPAIEAALTPRTRAIIPVHLYGRPANIAEIRAIADRQGLFLLEDAAQAHGARYTGARTGGLGNAAAFSFYPVKNLGGLGDGGAVTTDDEALAARLRRLRNYGSTEKYHHDVIGFNSRLDELQAAFLRIKLRYLDKWNSRRSEIAALYRSALDDLDVGLPPDDDNAHTSAWHQFVITCHERDRLQSQLAARGVATMVHYARPPHRQKAYADKYLQTELPHSDHLAEHCLSLPICASLSDARIRRVTDALRQCLSLAGNR